MKGGDIVNEMELKQQIVKAFDGLQSLDIQPTRNNITILMLVQDTILAVCDFLNALHEKEAVNDGPTVS